MREISSEEIAEMFSVAAAEIGTLETRRFAPEELNAPAPDLPDVPLHQRGFGVRDEPDE